MASGTAALAAKLVSKKSNNQPNKKKSSASKKTSSVKKSKVERSPRTNNTTHPWIKIKQLYEAGTKRNDIAKQLKIKVSSMNGIMDRLAAGSVMVNGKVVSITRGQAKKSKSKGK